MLAHVVLLHVYSSLRTEILVAQFLTDASQNVTQLSSRNQACRKYRVNLKIQYTERHTPLRDEGNIFGLAATWAIANKQ